MTRRRHHFPNAQQAPSKAASTEKRRRRRVLRVLGSIGVPDSVMPWERELLLPVVLQVIRELIEPREPGQGAKESGESPPDQDGR